MNLYEDPELFEETIKQTAQSLHIHEAIVEKDYYVTLLLKSLVTAEPKIIFKGGTSLSKCYKLIQRFSEDVDLNYDNEGRHPTEGMRRNFSTTVKESCTAFNLTLANPDVVVFPVGDVKEQKVTS